MLLSWGLSAMQWTVLTTNNDLRDAVANGELFQSETRTYSIPQGTERDVYVGFYFHAGPGYSSETGTNGSLFYGLTESVSNTTTTSQYYVSFSLTRPNGSAVNTWFTSPQGNLTQACGETPIVTCLLPPNPPGGSIGSQLQFFQAPTAGNYTVHLLSTQCPAGDYCTSTNATITVTRALSRVVYTRPYYNSGLATVIVAGVAITATIAFLSIIAYQVIVRRGRASSTRHQPSPPTAK